MVLGFYNTKIKTVEYEMDMKNGELWNDCGSQADE